MASKVVAAQSSVTVFHNSYEASLNPLTPMSDQYLQYQYNIKQTSDENKEKS